jgi:hydroxymethylglutaryl-CoA synthase
MDHAYDFYKPKLDSLYPIVNGYLSISCYFKALHQCYKLYTDKFHRMVTLILILQMSGDMQS